jgi:hypothetical protein
MRSESRVTLFRHDVRTVPVYVVGIDFIAVWIRTYQLYAPIVAHSLVERESGD